MTVSVKRWLTIATVAAVLAAAVLAGAAVADALRGGTAMAAETTGAAASSQRTITVAGEGKITVAPDVAYVHLGVFAESATANEAQAQNAKAFAAIEQVLKEKYGVAAADIKTSGFYVNPKYMYPENGEAKIVGYTASHDVSVTYRDLDKLGALLDDVSKAGANRVNGIQFGTEKSAEYELQAIEKAMENAKAKAETIAKAAGRSVAGVLHVQQGSVSGGPVPYPMARASYDMAESAGMPGTSVQPGELDITTTVTVTYEM